MSAETHLSPKCLDAWDRLVLKMGTVGGFAAAPIAAPT
jgi:hypothetical protein